MSNNPKKPALLQPANPGAMTAEQEARARAIAEEAKNQAAMQQAYDAAAARSMGTYKEPVKKAKGGMASASKRADGCAQRGKTRGKIV